MEVEAETSQNESVPLPEQPKNMEWLIEMMHEHEQSIKTAEEQAKQPTRPKTRIQKVDKTLRTESNNQCFDPLVVSLGPYHHGKENLMPMEHNKNVAAAWFISFATGIPANNITNTDAIYIYQKFVEKASMLSPQDCYADNFDDKYNEADLMRMMFLDGCFILQFIHLVVTGSSDDLWKSSHHLNQPHIVRDIFLLENQIPYPILNALMSILPEQKYPRCWIIEFIFTVFLPPHEWNFSELGYLRVLIVILECVFCLSIRQYVLSAIWKNLCEGDNEPLHLLHILRAVFIATRPSPDSSQSGYWYYYFRPIRELKATGIQVRKSNTRTLRDVKFKRGLLNSHLEIPQIIVDDSTRTHLINLVAYEMCSDGLKDRTVTSYVCLLHSLIYNAEDAKELESKNILLNRLGSNEEVANLFKELATDLSPHYNAYGHVINGIKDHLIKRHFSNERVRIGKWIGQFIRTYFSSPWTLISLIAAAFVIALTLLQTIYTIWGFYKTY